MPRIEPITGNGDVPAEYRSVLESVLARFGRVRGPFSVLLNSPRLAERLLSAGNYFHYDSIVEDKDKSLAIITAVRQREGAYVWAAQVGAARRAVCVKRRSTSSATRATSQSCCPKSE